MGFGRFLITDPDGHPGEGGLVSLRNRLPEHGIDVASGITVGSQEVGSVVVEGVDESVSTNFSTVITDELSTFTLSKSSSLRRTYWFFRKS